MTIIQLSLLDAPEEDAPLQTYAPNEPPTYAPPRLAALALRWAAQIASGETPELLSACTRPLRDVGLNMQMMEFMSRKWAAEALVMVETVEEELKAA